MSNMVNISFEYDDSNELLNSFAATVSLCNKEIEKLSNEVKELREAKGKFEKEAKELNIKKHNLSSVLALKEEALDKANVKISEIEQNCNNTLAILQSQVDVKTTEVISLQNENTSLQKSMNEFKTKYNELEEENKKNLKKISLQIPNLLFKTLDDISCALTNALSSINDSGLKSFVKEIVSSEDIDRPGLKILADKKDLSYLETSFEKSRSSLTNLLNLVWWFEQTELRKLIKSNIPDINSISILVKHLICLFNEVSNLKINIPYADFSKTISMYKENDNVKTLLKDLFAELKLEDYTMCEIFKLSLDGKEGECLIW